MTLDALEKRERTIRSGDARISPSLWLAAAVSLSIHAAAAAGIVGWVTSKEMPAVQILSIELVEAVPGEPGLAGHDAPAAEAGTMSPSQARTDKDGRGKDIKPADTASPLAGHESTVVRQGPSAVPAAESMRRVALPPPVRVPEPRPAGLGPDQGAPPSFQEARTAALPPSGALTPDRGEKSSSSTGSGGSSASPVPGNRPPHYPSAARRRGDEGTVVIGVDISAAGRGERVEIIQSSGYNTLDEAALEAVREWRFVPAKRDGIAVAGSLRIPVLFRLKD